MLQVFVIFLVVLPYHYVKKIQCYFKYKQEISCEAGPYHIAFFNKKMQEHNPYGPSCVFYSGDVEYCINGKLHNANGPAIIIGHRPNYIYTITDSNIPGFENKPFSWKTNNKKILKELYYLDGKFIGEDLHLYGDNAVQNFYLLG